MKLEAAWPSDPSWCLFLEIVEGLEELQKQSWQLCYVELKGPFVIVDH